MALMASFLVHWPSLVVALLASFFLYNAILLVYRVWFHPLANFPGSLLARSSFLYEFYHNYFLGGAYYLRIKDMHERYGPIIRVTPDELHINDPLFFHSIFVTHAVRKTNNYPRSADGTGFEDMTAISHYHDNHRKSRVPLDRYFSKASISLVEQRVLTRVQTLCHRLRELRGTCKVVNLFDAFSSLTTDAVSSMIFHEPSDFLRAPDFNNGHFYNLKMGILSVPILANLPWVARLLTSPVLKHLLEKATDWRVWDDKARRQIEKTRSRLGDKTKARDDTTVFDALINSDLVQAHFGNGGFARLALLLQQAGTYNVAHTLCTIVTYLLLDEDNIQQLQALRTELRSAFASRRSPTWRDLEKLPYLKATINEGLRMAIGAMNRSSRIAPDDDLIFQGSVRSWTIPRGTPVSMSSYWMHNDPKQFPEPHKFRPERWLCGPDKLKEMNQYFVPFSKGSRGCLAQEFVSMLLYLTLAELFRPGAPDLILHDTDASDVVPLHGYLFPLPKLDSQGVRVTVQ